MVHALDLQLDVSGSNHELGYLGATCYDGEKLKAIGHATPQRWNLVHRMAPAEHLMTLHLSLLDYEVVAREQPHRACCALLACLLFYATTMIS